MRARTIILEPMQKAFVSVPNDWPGQVTEKLPTEESSNMPSDGDVTTVVGIIPIAETLVSLMISERHHKVGQFGTLRT